MAILPRVPSSNNQQYTLDAQITAGATSLTLNQTVDSVVRAPGYLVIDRIDASGSRTPSKREYKKFTGVSGAQLTGLTSVDGTDQVHAVGAIAEFVPDVKYEQDWYDWALTEHTTGGGHASLPSLSYLNTQNLIVTTALNASGASLSGVYPSGASGAVLVSTGASAPVFAVATANDGWVDSAYTWTYASANTFTISGVNATSIFTKGTRLKFTQTTVKYAVVIASSFSTNTTVTIAVNTDYTIANAAITAPAYSYAANPQGYPDWFNYTAVIDTTELDNGTGGQQPTITHAKMRIIGATCFVQVYIATATKNTATAYIGLKADNLPTHNSAANMTLGHFSLRDGTPADRFGIVYYSGVFYGLIGTSMADNTTITRITWNFYYQI